MGSKLTPPERDRRAAQGTGQEGVEESSERGTQTWLWTLVGLIILIALAAGAIAGFLGGRLYERSRGQDSRDLYALLGALLTDESGNVYLATVYPYGPAGLAGLQDGDRLVSINAEPIRSAEQAQRIIMRYGYGDLVSLTVERGFRKSDHVVMLGIFISPVTTGPTIVPPPPDPPPGARQEGRLGVYYRMLQPGDPFGVAEGALIVSVFSGTPADMAGLQAGDIITYVGREPITGGSDLSDTLGRFAAGETVTLGFYRAGESLEARITLGGG